jgi:hypothetical protein
VAGREGGRKDETLLKALFFINSVSTTKKGRGKHRNPHRIARREGGVYKHRSVLGLNRNSKMVSTAEISLRQTAQDGQCNNPCFLLKL